MPSRGWISGLQMPSSPRSGANRGVLAPSGVRVCFDRNPGVLLRSTPGYLLSSPRDEKTDYHLEMV